MKFSIAFIFLAIFLQTGSCDDDSNDVGGSINENFVEFLGVRNEASGGCNEESIGSSESTCVYAGAYTNEGLGYAIAVSHEGLCRSATFNLRDNFDQSNNAFFVLQITEDGVAIETFLGFSGIVEVTDTGNISSLRFNGTVVSTLTGEEETIEGFLECPI